MVGADINAADERRKQEPLSLQSLPSNTITVRAMPLQRELPTLYLVNSSTCSPHCFSVIFHQLQSLSSTAEFVSHHALTRVGAIASDSALVLWLALVTPWVEILVFVVLCRPLLLSTLLSEA